MLDAKSNEEKLYSMLPRRGSGVQLSMRRFWGPAANEGFWGSAVNEGFWGLAVNEEFWGSAVNEEFWCSAVNEEVLGFSCQ